MDHPKMPMGVTYLCIFGLALPLSVASVNGRVRVSNGSEKRMNWCYTDREQLTYT